MLSDEKTRVKVPSLLPLGLPVAMRLFIATLLADANQTAYRDLVARLVREHRPLLRAIPDGSAHITFAFASAVHATSFSSVLETIDEVASRTVPIPVGLGVPHVLFSGRAARLLCADVIAGSDAVRSLARTIGDALDAGGRDDDWRVSVSPHVTLGRFKRGVGRREADAVRRSLAATGALELTDVVDRIQLIESQLTPSGASYRVRHQAEAHRRPA